MTGLQNLEMSRTTELRDFFDIQNTAVIFVETSSVRRTVETAPSNGTTVHKHRLK